ncbi:MAG: FAD-dependent oxidoreductase [Syntrophorhabdaceae bacterium]|nr:FAD-dependent oxidoreductase [Syntrophorhabdaceae bacterium]
MEKPKNKRVAIIGSGPAGLSAAYFLVCKGYGVTVFEALPVAGGMLAVGIPDYRLPKDVLRREIDGILSLGVEIRYNTVFGRDFGVDDLFEQGYEAVLVATGAHKGLKLGIPGEDAVGVLDGVTALRRLNLKETVWAKGRVIVIGGGNVAIDAARSALRLGADEVTILYRREKEDMPAYIEEIEEAEAEGVKILTLVAPQRIVTKYGKVTGIECIRMRLTDFDKTGRRIPAPIKGSEFTLEANMVIAAVGQAPDTSFVNGDGIKIGKDGTIVVDTKSLETQKRGVFAAGDAIRGPATVVEAIADGRHAAMSIDRFLGGDGKMVSPSREELLRTRVSYDESLYQKEMARMEMPSLSIPKRNRNFNEVFLGYQQNAAIEEAKRCLHCYLKEETQ